MKISVSFLICSREKNNEPIVAVKKVNDKYQLPTFDFDNLSDIDNFVKDKFKELSSFDAKFKSIDGWVNIFICGTIVDLDSSSIVYACYAPETFENKNGEWKSMSLILEDGVFESSYTDQVISCFNYFSR
jgi:hypothetical protein